MKILRVEIQDSPDTHWRVGDAALAEIMLRAAQCVVMESTRGKIPSVRVVPDEVMTVPLHPCKKCSNYTSDDSHICATCAHEALRANPGEPH